MKRILAGLALCVAVALGTTGCGVWAQPGAQQPWSRVGAGVNIENVGSLAVRNVLIVANEDGTEGQLIAAVINNTDEDRVLHIQVGEESVAALTIPVPAESNVSFGQQDSLEDPPLIEGLDALPGSMVPLYFQVGDNEPIRRDVPVLDGCLPYLEGLEPDGQRTPGECPDEQ
jgi:hypothetical protein